MSVERCPYCGKPFKRLKSHLPHCKMAPFAQPLKSTQTPQDLPKNAITSKQKINKKILTENNYLVFDDRQTSNDRRKEELIVDKMSVHNAESSIATTEVTAFVNTERPQSKWSAKRQKEYERFQKLAVLQKSINYTSVSSDHERDKSFHEISNGQEKGASQTNGTPTKAKKKLKVAPLSEPLSIHKSTTIMPAIPKSTNLSSKWSLCCENPKCTVMAEMEPNSKSSDLNLVSRVKELKALTFFTSKTSVWDHIKGSLYYKRSCNLLLPCPVLGTHTSDFETKYISVTTQLSKKLETTKPFTPSFNFSETSIQRPVEDVHSSRLQGVRSLGWNPEIMTSFRILFSSEPFRNSSDDNMWKKHPFSGPSSHSEVLRLIVKERHLHQLGWTRAIRGSIRVPLIQRKLADVRLKEFGVWLGDQSPKSPREFGTVLKQGWQWYYTKYIDVRRGGIGGISLLLAGYCVLCYIWRYPDLKKERWRKYH